MNKIEIDIVINILESIILLAEKIHPGLDKNPTIIAVNKVITYLKSLGI